MIDRPKDPAYCPLCKGNGFIVVRRSASEIYQGKDPYDMPDCKVCDGLGFLTGPSTALDRAIKDTQ